MQVFCMFGIGGNTVVERYKFQRNYFIFEVEDTGYGTGKEPTGYIKIEIRKGRGKLSALVQDIRNTTGFSYNLCAFDCSRNDIFRADICKIEVYNNKAEIQLEFNPYDFFNTRRSIDNFSVFAVLVEPKESESLKIICPLAAYKDKKTEWRGKLKTKVVSYPAGGSKDFKEEEKPEEYLDNVNKGNYIEKIKEIYEEKQRENVEELTEKNKEIKEYNKEIEEEQIEEYQGEQQEEQIEKYKEEHAENHTEKRVIDITKEYLQKDKEESKREYKEEDKEDSEKGSSCYEENHEGDNVPIEEKRDSNEEQGKKSISLEHGEGQNPRYWHCPAGISSCIDCSVLKERGQTDANSNKTFDFGMLVEYFDKYFEKSDPFNSRRRDYRWWEVNTLVYLNNILYQFGIKTSDLFNTNVMMAHLKYRHLIVGIYTDRIRHRGYVVFGIPGVYNVDTRPLGGACRWVQLKGSRPREGAFGYWLAYYEPESGEFLNFS